MHRGPLPQPFCVRARLRSRTWPSANDTRAALQVAADLGASVSSDGNTYTIRGGLDPKCTSLNIGESGLATRLFTPITALCDREITLYGTGSILKRPIAMMEGPLNALGARTSSNNGYLPIRICGPMHGGNITVDGSLSSQFITGLLMTLPTVAQDTILTVENLRSRPYIDMTIGLLKEFDIDIQHNDYQQFYIKGGQQYRPYDTTSRETGAEPHACWWPVRYRAK